MRFKNSALPGMVFVALFLTAKLVSANTDVGSDSGDATELATEVTQTETAIDQAAIVPENDADKAKGIDVWNNIYQVLSHPRCVNCHVPDDRPRWSGESYGRTRVHGMNVQATATRVGIPGQQACSTCHAKTNADVPHGPPGAEVWALAPAEMIWWGKSSQQLCAMVKNPDNTGGRDVSAFAEHIGHDALVAWAWNPGVGREPAPFSVGETVAMLEQWLALGLPCPE